MIFRDRSDAARRLAERLSPLKGEDLVVLGLPRGGVPVAAEVAKALGAPLDVIVVRKLGVPYQPELAMGAVGEGGVLVRNEQVLRMVGVSPRELAAVEARERAEVERRAKRFRGDRPPVPLAGRVALLVDDGIATGSTARAACRVARAQGAARVLLAVPVAPADTVGTLGDDADEVICLQTPERFSAVGEWYADFSQTTDDEVTRLLQETPGRRAGPEDLIDLTGRDEEVTVVSGDVNLPGRLTLPAAARGVVVFAHGSGSSRHSPRNRAVAAAMNRSGLGTLLFDLLTPAEEVDRENVFDIGLLAGRLVGATRWLEGQPGCRGLPVGYFGASTGAAAALWAAGDPQVSVAAVVSRGGRPDLAGPALTRVSAPTLLLVGGRDDVVLELNREAQARLHCENRLVVVPGATHLFEEPGALQSVAELAANWFVAHLAPHGATARP
ncbi:MAG: phosphoribosyltransferase family protein [Mycobacteriales bacterium]